MVPALATSLALLLAVVAILAFGAGAVIWTERVRGMARR